MKSRPPAILDEDATIDRVLSGASLARIGDGELAISRGYAIKSQDANPTLARLMRDVLATPGQCLVGIVRPDPRSPKQDHIRKCWAPHYAGYYRAPLYASAYISRPDSAPWINRPDYWAKVRRIWEGQNVVLVRGSTKSFHGDLAGARTVEEIVAPRHNAFDDFTPLVERLKGEKRRVLLCLGPTATALAWWLSNRHAVHAIDLGHLGMFMRKLDAGEVLEVTEEDRAQ